MPPQVADISVHFWSRVEKLGFGPSDCWEWMGYRNPKGYGQLRYANQAYLAHRLAWILRKGEIPRGLAVCHTCDNPACVRVTHLFLGTLDDNNKDMASKGRHADFRGELHPKAILTANQVRWVRQMRGVMRQIDIAAELGVHRTTVSQIQRGVIWSSV